MLRDRRKPARRWVAAVLSLQVVLAGSPSFAQKPKATESKPAPSAPAPLPQDLVARGREFFEDQRYEESIQTLSAALLRPSNTIEQKVEIYRLLALNYITLGRTEEADSAIRGLLVVAPDYQLPASESPRFRDFFKDARTKWEAEGRPGIVVEKPPPRPTVLRHGSPSSAEKDKPIDLRAKLDDPDHRAAHIKIYYRTGSQGEFQDIEADVEGDAVRAQIPAAAVKPPVIDYYIEVEDQGGGVLLSRGDAQAPLRIAIPDGGSGWVLPLAIGGGILGAAAIVGGLALAGVFKSSSPSPPGSARVTVNVGEAGFRF
jgi:hypothetical protein